MSIKSHLKASLLIFFFFLSALPSAGQNVDTAWVRIYGSRYGVYLPSAITVDALGNVYVTGSSEGKETYQDYVTIKYDSSGNQLWAKTYSGPGYGDDWAYAICLDDSGNVFVTGYITDSKGNCSYATIKYYFNGDTAWVRTYGGHEGLGGKPGHIILDSSRNVYVTGTGGTIKYDKNGNFLWAIEFGGYGIVSDNMGNLYITGERGTAKYSPNGDELWRRTRRGSRIATDNFGNIYVIGYTAGGMKTRRDYVTVKYNSAGNELWVREYNERVNSADVCRAIAVDGWGNVYVTGKKYITGKENDDYATIKYDPNGNRLWVKRYDGTAEYSQDAANDIVLDSYGNVYVTGRSYGKGTRSDCVTVKYAPNGIELWAERYDVEGGFDYGDAIVVDSSGNIYVTGSANGSDAGYNILTIKYSETGSKKKGRAENKQ